MPDLLKIFLYFEAQHGTSPVELAAALGIPEDWIAEHIEAARLCFQSQVRIEVTNQGPSSLAVCS